MSLMQSASRRRGCIFGNYLVQLTPLVSCVFQCMTQLRLIGIMISRLNSLVLKALLIFKQDPLNIKYHRQTLIRAKNRKILDNEFDLCRGPLHKTDLIDFTRYFDSYKTDQLNNSLLHHSPSPPAQVKLKELLRKSVSPHREPCSLSGMIQSCWISMSFVISHTVLVDPVNCLVSLEDHIFNLRP